MTRRARFELYAPSATPEQAAAIAAAIERFMRDHAPAPAAPAAQLDGWLAAALREGVERQPAFEAPDPWFAR